MRSSTYDFGPTVTQEVKNTRHTEGGYDGACLSLLACPCLGKSGGGVFRPDPTQPNPTEANPYPNPNPVGPGFQGEDKVFVCGMGVAYYILAVFLFRSK